MSAAIPLEAASQAFSDPTLEAIAQELRRGSTCSIGPGCLLCAERMSEARTKVIAIWNMGVAAALADHDVVDAMCDPSEPSP